MRHINLRYLLTYLLLGNYILYM